jgi:hypothetical protein
MRHSLSRAFCEAGDVRRVILEINSGGASPRPRWWSGYGLVPGLRTIRNWRRKRGLSELSSSASNEDSDCAGVLVADHLTGDIVGLAGIGTTRRPGNQPRGLTCNQLNIADVKGFHLLQLRLSDIADEIAFKVTYECRGPIGESAPEGLDTN